MLGFPCAVRTAFCWLPIILWTSALGAQTCLVLSPATITTDHTAWLDLALYSSPGSAPAAVQWTFQYRSSNISSLTVDDGPMLTSAGKTAICTGNAAATNCLAVGHNTKTVANGVIAKVTAVLAPGATTAPVQITNPRGIGQWPADFHFVDERTHPWSQYLGRLRSLERLGGGRGLPESWKE
jgi:hypothetical protein